MNLQPTKTIVSHEALNACADASKSSLNSNTRKIIARPFDNISPSVNQNIIIIIIIMTMTTTMTTTTAAATTTIIMIIK